MFACGSVFCSSIVMETVFPDSMLLELSESANKRPVVSFSWVAEVRPLPRLGVLAKVTVEETIGPDGCEGRATSANTATKIRVCTSA